MSQAFPPHSLSKGSFVSLSLSLPFPSCVSLDPLVSGTCPLDSCFRSYAISEADLSDKEPVTVNIWTSWESQSSFQHFWQRPADLLVLCVGRLLIHLHGSRWKTHRVWHKSVYSCEDTEQSVPVLLFVNYCVPSHTNNCKPAFVPPCILNPQ